MIHLQAASVQIVDVDESENVVTRFLVLSGVFRTILHCFCHEAVEFLEGIVWVHLISLKNELSKSDVRIGSVNKHFLVVSLHPAAPPLMVDVKLEDIVAKNANGNDIVLSSTARVGNKQL